MIPRCLILLAVLWALNLCPTQATAVDTCQEVTKEVMAGEQLNADEVKALEAVVAKQPDDLTARMKLLGYYFMRQYSSSEAKAAGQQHILWIIKNRPASAVAGLPYCTLDPNLNNDGYQQGKQLWLEQTKDQATNTAVLGNAAGFFLLHDKELAEDLLKQAQKAEPNSPEWSERLGQLYALQTMDDDGVKTAAAKALQEFERAQAADTDESSRNVRLDDLAKQAFKAGEIKKASHYASDLLVAVEKNPKDWNQGNAIHVGNTVLGQIALSQGQIKQAKEYLLKAGHTPGSPQLNSFGPNMSLAKELLEKGEKRVVLQYFDLCRKFWTMGGERLDKWTKEVKAGIAPEFGANLIY